MYIFLLLLSIESLLVVKRCRFVLKYENQYNSEEKLKKKLVCVKR